MKRDMDLIRGIALRLEDSDEWIDLHDLATDLDLPNYSNRQIDEHLLMMREAALLEGERELTLTGVNVFWNDLRLTWHGHEFLAAARDDKVWKQATGRIAAKVGTVTFEVLTRVLSDVAARTLGLP